MSEERTGGLHRRTVIQGAAGIAAVTSVAAACGSGEQGSAKATPAPEEVIAKADVPNGTGTVTKDYVVTQPQPGQYYAFSNVCPHAGCKVSTVKMDVIECQCHGSRFSTTDGSVKTGPAQSPLPKATITDDGANLKITPAS